MSAVAERKTIELENVGPIERLSIPIPEGGGLVILKGRNGKGKSHGLAAVGSLYSKEQRKNLRNSDGTPSGLVQGLGVTIRLGRSNTIKGELVCESLDGSVDPSVLVDPGLKDPVAADTKRLATLVRLAGISVDVETWRSAIGAEIAEAVGLDSLYDSDPVLAADRLRRKLHELALARERKADKKSQEAAAIQLTIADVNIVDEESNSFVLQKAVEEATEALAAAKQQRADALVAREKQQEARRLLEENEAKAVDLAEVSSRVSTLQEKLTDRTAEYRDLTARLEIIRTEMEKLESQIAAAQDLRAVAVKQQEQLAKWRALVESEATPPISEEELAALDAAKQAAIAAMKRGEVVQRAIMQTAQAGELNREAKVIANAAKQLRELAVSSDSVLENALKDQGFDSIRVYQGRLCVESDRGLEPFAELSHGERWRLALDLAAQGLAKGSVLPVCQEAYESLDPENRQFVRMLAKERGIVLVSAEATDGDLRAEVVDDECEVVK